MSEITYTADEVEYMVDMGTYIECPDCGDSVTIDWMLREGCWKCDRPPWSFTVEVE